ncbi:MAG: exo-beta-N-acetylmuramidase NamZ domain-containing protein [Oligosphaeraceae bacterium]
MACLLPGIHGFSPGAVQGKPCALLTNDAARDARGRRTVDCLREMGVEVTLLLSPEHGLAGTAQAGEGVGDGRDAATGLPVVSLYGRRREVPPELWRNFYIMIFDLPDVGVRYFTYADTILRVMEECARRGRPAILLDRPNPLGAEREGPLLEPELRSDVGCAGVPVRHGLTLGELLRFAARERGFLSSLAFQVVPSVRLPSCPPEPLFPDFGTPWRRPSPNLPSFEALCCYPGTCLFEGTNLSEGRGTEAPFQLVGAPFLEGEAVLELLGRREYPGLRLSPARFAPRASKHQGCSCGGVRFEVTDPRQCRSFGAALEVLDAVRRLHPRELVFLPEHFDHLLGSRAYRLGRESCQELLARASRQSREFLP